MILSRNGTEAFRLKFPERTRIKTEMKTTSFRLDFFNDTEHSGHSGQNKTELTSLTKTTDTPSTSPYNKFANKNHQLKKCSFTKATVPNLPKK